MKFLKKSFFFRHRHSIKRRFCWTWSNVLGAIQTSNISTSSPVIWWGKINKEKKNVIRFCSQISSNDVGRVESRRCWTNETSKFCNKSFINVIPSRNETNSKWFCWSNLLESRSTENLSQSNESQWVEIVRSMSDFLVVVSCFVCQENLEDIENHLLTSHQIKLETMNKLHQCCLCGFQCKRKETSFFEHQLRVHSGVCYSTVLKQFLLFEPSPADYPVCSSSRSSTSLDTLTEKVKEKLDVWKRKFFVLVFFSA